MFQYCVYLLYRAGIFLLGSLPLPVLFALGRFGGAVAWISFRNIARSPSAIFGSHSAKRCPAQGHRLVRRHFQHLGANLLCSIKFAQMPMEKILDRVRVENFEHITDCSRSKRPVVILLSHTGPWELCTRLFPHFVRDPRKATIYQRMRNLYIDAHVRDARGHLVLRCLIGKKVSRKRSAYCAMAGFWES